MSTDLKSFESPSMKDQAIAHWEENLKRVKAMNWRRWAQARDTTRRTIVFGIEYNRYPHISGDACPYCIRYHIQCRTEDNTEQCPLKQEHVPGGCCLAWLKVREALIEPWSKAQAITAIEDMIEYIKERG